MVKSWRGDIRYGFSAPLFLKRGLTSRTESDRSEESEAMKKLAGRGGVFGMSGVFRIFDQIIKTKNQEVITAEPFLQPRGGYRKLREIGRASGRERV